MSPFPRITAVFLETIIGPLVPWFLIAAGGDAEAARDTVISMLASYDVETEEELRLATEIVSFSFTILGALSQSMDPDLPLNSVLRLRGSANALQRSKNQCQRSLDRLRKDRRKGAAAPQVHPAAPQPAALPRDQTNSAQPAKPSAGFTASPPKAGTANPAIGSHQPQHVRRPTCQPTPGVVAPDHGRQPSAPSA